MTVQLSQEFAVSPARLWAAITDPAEMRQWFFEPIQDFEPTVGFATEFDLEAEGRVFSHQWEVLEVIPQQRIVYSWRMGGYPGDSTVTWQLTPVADGTRLDFLHDGNESFPQDDPMFTQESCEAGWQYLLQESLVAFLQR